MISIYTPAMLLMSQFFDSRATPVTVPRIVAMMMPRTATLMVFKTPTMKAFQ